MRGKDHDSQIWDNMQTASNSIQTKCVEGYDLCTYFPVAYIPYITYDMYDVMIEIHPSQTLLRMSSIDIDFHIAYFNPEHTNQQIALKITFTMVSILAFLIFMFKVASILEYEKLEDKKSVPFDTVSVAILLLHLVFFNDPWFYTHVYAPSFFTYVISEFGTAIFVSALLIFWLRDIARYRLPRLEKDASKLQRFFFKSMGMSNKILVWLGLFYITFTISFLSLYCLFYI